MPNIDPTPTPIPWWVIWWLGPETTGAGLRRRAAFFFLAAVVILSVGIVDHYWPEVIPGTIVLPVALGLFPAALLLAGIWILVAKSWMDRHQAWDQVRSEAK